MTQTKTHTKFFILVAVIAAFAGILFVYDTGVISGAILFINQEFQLSAKMTGFVVSSVLIGAFFGAIVSGRITDNFGRKRLLIVDAITFIIGTLISSFAPNVTTLICGRIIVGIAIGIASYTAPLYISEISPPKYRGRLVSLNQLTINIGLFSSYLIDYFFALHADWRWMMGVGIIPALVLLIGMILLPFSPRWAISKNKNKKALEILRKIRGKDADIMTEFEEIQKSLKAHKGNWKMLFSPIIRPALVIGMGLAFIQQATGINTILYFAPTIIKDAGLGGDVTAILDTVGIGFMLVLFTIIVFLFVDTLGRRPLLLIGLTGMSVGLAGISWGLSIQAFALSKIIVLGSMTLYIACFSFSMGPIMWLLISEIYPLRVRGLGSSLATCTNWASNWLVSYTFLILVQFLGSSYTFIIYFAFCVLSIAFVYFLVPETKGVTLEHIEQNLYARKSSRRLGR